MASGSSSSWARAANEFEDWVFDFGSGGSPWRGGDGFDFRPAGVNHVVMSLGSPAVWWVGAEVASVSDGSGGAGSSLVIVGMFYGRN